MVAEQGCNLWLNLDQRPKASFWIQKARLTSSIRPGKSLARRSRRVLSPPRLRARMGPHRNCRRGKRDRRPVSLKPRDG